MKLKKVLTKEEYAKIRYKRREAACFIYYRPADGQYYIGKTKYGEPVSDDAQASVYLGSSLPVENGVPKDAICITTCHTHTPFLDGSFEQERRVGPSEGDYAYLSNGDESNYGIVLDYIGIHVKDEGDFVFPGHSVTDPPQMYIYYNNTKTIDKYSFND